MPKRSAGLLVYRRRNGGPNHGQDHGQDRGHDGGSVIGLEVFLVHPGGPLWAKKDCGAWSIPKGEYDAAEPPLQAAIREFGEETGFSVGGDFLDLGVIRQAGGKLVSAWACASDFDPAQLISNECEIEWPPRSGQRILIPEVDRGAWFDLAEARTRILESQQEFLDRLLERLPA
ncbi:MAG TPA: NUDIX domain-containing protein [Acidobacteriaceae bacterium]|jgi:predicted NUDIX family NTP pyrophosphohydrolase|nr:NUDIX domain-containing protein [Acidobacteriaceae bacterium]